VLDVILNHSWGIEELNETSHFSSWDKPVTIKIDIVKIFVENTDSGWVFPIASKEFINKS
jgi:hypothetical protein